MSLTGGAAFHAETIVTDARRRAFLRAPPHELRERRAQAEGRTPKPARAKQAVRPGLKPPHAGQAGRLTGELPRGERGLPNLPCYPSASLRTTSVESMGYTTLLAASMPLSTVSVSAVGNQRVEKTVSPPFA